MSSVDSLLSPGEYTWDGPSFLGGLQHALPPENNGLTDSSVERSPRSGPFVGATVNDVNMLDVPPEATRSNETLVMENRPQRKRARHPHLKWEERKSRLGQLYLREEKSYEEIMTIMKDEDFDPTLRQYKEQFKTWGWKRYLPARVAHFIVQKANERQRKPPGKETVFTFGGLQRTKEQAAASLRRTKKNLDDLMSIATPEGLSYKTPAAMDMATPENMSLPDGTQEEAMEVSSDSSADETEVAHSSTEEEAEEAEEPISEGALLMTYNERTAADLHELVEAAQKCIQEEQPSMAQDFFQAAIDGYKHLFGPTHGSTAKAVLSLASFYAENDRIQDAYPLIEESISAHIRTFGILGEHTQQHIMVVVGLFNAWGRETDALAVINHTRMLSEIARDRVNSKSLGGNKRNQVAPGSSETALSAQLLLDTIDQCNSDIVKFAVQRLQAWNEPLNLDHQSQKLEKEKRYLVKTHQALQEDTKNFPWSDHTREQLKSQLLIEKLLQLAMAIPEAGFHNQAKTMLRNVETKVETVFASDSERTIWILITVGLAYRNRLSWDDAKQCFDQALSDALLEYNAQHGIVISLADVMEVPHFSYVNAEGQPYKTIFAVSGLTV
ncbi:MAG: hypothetical protein M1821_005080 [Bathelium mastoideum]|nr:MAG: hypothetical protein M1821_005080 [Bathelium mastoideum]